MSETLEEDADNNMPSAVPHEKQQEEAEPARPVDDAATKKDAAHEVDTGRSTPAAQEKSPTGEPRTTDPDMLAEKAMPAEAASFHASFPTDHPSTMAAVVVRPPTSLQKPETPPLSSPRSPHAAAASTEMGTSQAHGAAAADAELAEEEAAATGPVHHRRPSDDVESTASTSHRELPSAMEGDVDSGARTGLPHPSLHSCVPHNRSVSLCC